MQRRRAFLGADTNKKKASSTTITKPSTYRLAAERGYAAAQCALGFMYATGRGVEHDDNEAVRLYRLAAGRVCSGAVCSWVHVRTRKRRRARRRPSSSALPSCRRGRGRAGAVPSWYHVRKRTRRRAHDNEAARLFRLAAEAGDAEAQHLLENMVTQGPLA